MSWWPKSTVLKSELPVCPSTTSRAILAFALNLRNDVLLWLPSMAVRTELR